MPNEEMLSALKNAIDHGESLQSAVQIMINSGYNSEEVQEASRFIGGTLSMQEIMPEEQLTMPEEKPSKFKFWAKDKKQDQTSQTMQTQQPRQQTSQFKQPIQQYPQKMQSIQQPVQQLPQYSQQITQAQIKQSFQHPMQQYPQSFQQPQKFQQPVQQYPQQISQPAQQYPQQQIPRQAPKSTLQLTPRQGELSREIQKIKPAKQGYMKEIILLIILLILIGVLAATIFFKDKILAWFS